MIPRFVGNFRQDRNIDEMHEKIDKKGIFSVALHFTTKKSGYTTNCFD